MKPETKGLVQLNLAVLLWAGTAMFAKAVPLPVTHLTCIRYLCAAAALFPVVLVLQPSLALNRKRDYPVVALSGIFLALNSLTIFRALRVSSAAVALLSFYSYPVFTALVEPWWFREKLKVADLLLAAGIFAGIVIMTPEFSLANRVTLGICLGVLSGVFSMLRNLLTRQCVRDTPCEVLMFWQALAAGLFLIPCLFAVPVEIRIDNGAYVVLLGVVFTAVPQTLSAASLGHLNARTAGVIATTQPIYAAVLGAFIHDEVVTPRTLVGGGVVLAFFVLETLRAVRLPQTRQGDP